MDILYLLLDKFNLGTVKSINNQTKKRQAITLARKLEKITESIANLMSEKFKVPVEDIRQNIDLFRNVMEVDVKEKFQNFVRYRWHFKKNCSQMFIAG